MKKLLSLLVAAGVLSAANVMAKDFSLVDEAQKIEDAKTDATKKWEAKKAANEKMKNEKKAAQEAKKAEQKAKVEAKKKAIKDAGEKTKADFGTLKDALSK